MEGANFNLVGDNPLRSLLAGNSGSKHIGTIQPLSGSVATTQESKNREKVSFDDFGITGTADDTVVMQAALNSGAKRIHAIAGRNYKFSQLIISADSQEIVIESGATIEAIVPNVISINVIGAGCSISGKGKIKGQPVFDGANTRPTYATVWVTGNGFSLTGITFDTTPKEAVMFEDSTYHTVSNCRFLGGYPQASYDENTTTNQCAIMSNIPGAASHPSPWILITGNHFEGYIQGCLVANYGAAGNNTGVTITGNTFKDCWDHGVYMSRGLSHNVSNNIFLGCRRPIVCDGIGAVVVGNTLYAGTATGSNREQVISVREASYCVVANNTIYGYDASILVDCIETTVMTGNLIANNNIRSTGTAFVTCGIRLGVGAQECVNNTISGNKIHSGFFGTSGAGIELSMAGGFANNTRVINNEIRRIDAGGFGINGIRHNYAEIRGNSFVFSGVASGATQTTAILLDLSSFLSVEQNKVFYTLGGTNVSMTGINIGASSALAKIRDNSFACTSASLVSFTAMTLGSDADVTDNLLDPNAKMTGTFTWASGSSSCLVPNLNIGSGSLIIVTPVDNGAAAVVRDLGFYAVAGIQSFKMFTAGGVSTLGSSSWNYRIA